VGAYIEYYRGDALEMVNFDGRTLQIGILGACQDCALASGALHGWVKGAVRPFFPEPQQVEAVP
jgi:Fe-S cluster biogenesis protein NfuA